MCLGFCIVSACCTDISGGGFGNYEYSPIISNEITYASLLLNLTVLGLGLIMQPIIYKNNIEYLRESNKQNKYLILFSIAINTIGIFLGNMNNSLWLGTFVLLILLGINIIMLSVQNLIQALLIKKLDKQQLK